MNKKVFAAALACSNMGQRVDEKTFHRIVRIYNEPINIEDCVDALCGPFMESDEHERIFYGEGKMWLEHLMPMTEDEIAKQHPQLYELYTKAV